MHTPAQTYGLNELVFSRSVQLYKAAEYDALSVAQLEGEGL
jgi:hypothetical protein